MADQLYLISLILITTLIEVFVVIFKNQLEEFEALRIFLAMIIALDIFGLSGLILEII